VDPKDEQAKNVSIPEVDPERLEKERTEVRGILAQAQSSAVPRMAVTAGNRLTPLYPDKKVAYGLILKAIGVTDGEFFEGILDQIVELCCVGPMPSEYTARVNFVLAVVREVKPRNQLETMLALQMAASHMQSMAAGRDFLSFCHSHPIRLNAPRSFRLFTKTYMDQLETLKRLRSTGEQKITVQYQYISVKDGGQAVVGDVTQQKTIVVKKGPAKLPTENETQPIASVDENHQPGRVAVLRRKSTLK
jgi:hypothetical protein